jgi:hypothetical protein
LKDFATNAVPILMQSNGGGWMAEPLLWHLAHKQLGIDLILPLASGFIPSEQLIREFKEKIWESIRFAKPYVEPLQLPESVVRDYQKNLPSVEEYRKLRNALKKAPRPKHPQRHKSAESLLHACENILNEVEAHEKKFSPAFLANWCHLMSQVFEAGKAHAYLERDRDPQTLAENRKGARMMGKPPSSERSTVENAFEAFFQENERAPQIAELRRKLAVHIVKNQNLSLPDDCEFAGLKMLSSKFNAIFKAVSKKFKKQSL